jgi:hypothetical protein
MDHGMVLNIRSRTDRNIVHVAAKGAAEPDTAILADGDIAGDNRVLRDEGRVRNPGQNAFIRKDNSHGMQDSKKNAPMKRGVF